MPSKKTPDPERKLVVIEKPAKRLIVVTIVGETPLQTRRLSDLAKRKIAGETIRKDEEYTADEDFDQAIYWAKNEAGVEVPCMNAAAFRKGMVDSCRSTGDVMIKTKQLFAIKARFCPIWTFNAAGERVPHQPILAVEYPDNARKGRVFSRRAEYALPYEIDVPIQYNANQTTDTSMVHLLLTMGFAVGLGSGRNECNGTNGQFTVKGWI